MRAAIGLSAVIQGGVNLYDESNQTLVAWVVGSLSVASGALLLVGFLTPVAALLFGLGNIAAALLLSPTAAQTFLDNRPSIVFVIIVAVAIVLLGPGAYSLDARLFGRREIIIPQHCRPPES